MEQIGKLFLDDFYVGREFRSSEHALDAEQIKAFGSQFDPQPFHLDEEKANGSVFQGLAASGWHTAAVTMKLLVQSVPFAHGIIGAGGEIEWPSAARPGDVLHVDSKVLEIKPSRSKPDRGFVVLEGRTVNQTGEVRQIVKARLMAFKK